MRACAELCVTSIVVCAVSSCAAERREPDSHSERERERYLWRIEGVFSERAMSSAALVQGTLRSASARRKWRRGQSPHIREGFHELLARAVAATMAGLSMQRGQAQDAARLSTSSARSASASSAS